MLLPHGESDSRCRYYRLGLILLVLVIAGFAGVWAGNKLADKRAVANKQNNEARRLDENLGLGQRTGLTGDLDLKAAPIKLTVDSGKPVKVVLTLTNKTRKLLMLNDWFTPAPADFKSNQLPFKVIVSKSGHKVPFLGNIALFPPHAKKDFLRLNAGKSKMITVELSNYHGIGRWDMTASGNYTIELWYETYLTGKYVGVNAWTGMTNHVILQVTVRPQEGKSR